MRSAHVWNVRWFENLHTICPRASAALSRAQLSPDYNPSTQPRARRSTVTMLASCMHFGQSTLKVVRVFFCAFFAPIARPSLPANVLSVPVGTIPITSFSSDNLVFYPAISLAPAMEACARSRLLFGSVFSLYLSISSSCRLRHRAPPPLADDAVRPHPDTRRCKVNAHCGGRDHHALGPLRRAWGVLGGINHWSRETTTFLGRTTAAKLVPPAGRWTRRARRGGGCNLCLSAPQTS